MGRRVDLAIGIVLGVIVGIAVAYVLVMVVGSERDASGISTGTEPSGGVETRARPGG